MRILLLILLTTVIFPADSASQAVSARVGTTGIGFDLSMPIGTSMSIRAGGSFFSLSKSAIANDDEVDVAFEGRLRTGGIRLMSDWHPFRNNLRLTGGLFYNLIEVSGTGTPVEPFYLNEGQSNEKVFQPQRLGELTATLSYENKFSPYIGIGFGDGARGKRISFLADLGAIYLGSPSVEMDGSGMIAGTATQESTITEGLKSFKWMPVFTLGVSLRLTRSQASPK